MSVGGFNALEIGKEGGVFRICGIQAYPGELAFCMGSIVGPNHDSRQLTESIFLY